MPHLLVNQAYKILKFKNEYPEVIVSFAESITSFNEERRTYLKWLWENRHLLNKWIKARNASTESTYAKRAQYATRVLDKEFDRELMKKFHLGKKQLKTISFEFGMTFLIFDAMIKVLECKDINAMNHYISCVNAERYDNSDAVVSVSFVRNAGMSRVAEILSWRLAKQMQGQNF